MEKILPSHLFLFTLFLLILSLSLEKNNEEKYPRFSSFKGFNGDNNKMEIKFDIPYTDTYSLNYSTTTVKAISLKILNKTQSFLEEDEYESIPIKSNKNSDNTVLEFELDKGKLLLLIIECQDKNLIIEFEVKALKHLVILPYEPLNLEEDNYENLNSNYDLYTKANEDPLKPSQINYKKRDGGLYINCNNPERLTDEDLHKGLVRNDISNKEVFFTFEHNNLISNLFYYGYQVINKGNQNAYITVKNIGFQLDGPGTYLGEKEWIYFYNQNFKLLYKDKWTESQKSNFKAYFGFCDNYESQNFQPITFQLPPGKYFYVIGGTTEDSFLNINVANTANKQVKGGCSNGAVLFDVIGNNIEGVFYVYQDPKKINIDNLSHQGYIIIKEEDKLNYGSQYNGYDKCKGVIDMNAEWAFNDNTPEQLLPVEYVNYYMDGVSEDDLPFSEIQSKIHSQINDTWITHLNPQNVHSAVGTDMTKYFTLYNGQPIYIDSDHFDGNGKLANIGNWMIDYIEKLTFVNNGYKDRNITIKKFHHNGALAIFVRDDKGNIINGTRQYAIHHEPSSYGEGIYDYFVYKTLVKANSALTVFVEYNLLANSNGNIRHEVKLE